MESLLLLYLLASISIYVTAFPFSSFAYSKTFKGSHTSICSTKVEELPDMNNFLLPPLLAKSSANVDHFVKQLCETMRLTPTYISPDEIDVEDLILALENREPATLLVIDDIELIKKAYDILKEARSVYIMSEQMEINPDERKASLYDIWLPSLEHQPLNMNSAVLSLMTLMNRMRSIPSKEDTLLDAGLWSHFVSLTFPSIDKGLVSLPTLRIGADAFELRVDLLEDISIPSLHRQIALLRAACPLPIVFTVRSKGQIGKFPNDQSHKMFELLEEGLRAGCEWIDVEACWEEDLVNSLTDKALADYASTSRLLGSLHVTSPQIREQVRSLFESSKLGNKAHILKVVTGAAGEEDCELIHQVGSDVIASAATSAAVYIGVCLGANGSKSRVSNRRFTPVNHPLMATAAPGQLSAKELMSIRLQEGLITPRKFYLFGTPIGKSLSPAMHNAAYATLLLPHTYSLSESADINLYQGVFSDGAFGGASVTIPHKEAIIPMLDEVRGAALKIGAVNTVVVETTQTGWAGLVSRREKKLIGYNTDWLGIFRPIFRKLRSRGVNWKAKNVQNVGIVVGAGGTARAACYAVLELGLELLVINRTPDKGQELASMFGGVFLSDLSSESLENAGFDKSRFHVIISTVPFAAAYTAPKELLLAHKPVILDVVYTPARTKLIQQAIDTECSFVQGATMLLEQALEQFQLWNKRRAPRDVMEEALFKGVEKLDTSPI